MLKTTVLVVITLLVHSQGVVSQDPKPMPYPADQDPKTTASGLVYSILKAGGDGPSPKMGDTVKVHYTGWLVNGTEFDSSRGRGMPTEFTIGQVIPGWNEGLGLITAGGRIKLTIPPELGYGAQGQPPTIPGGSTLIFDVELLEVRSLPAFKKANAEATKTLENGLKYEVLKEGTGDLASETEILVFGFAVWMGEERLLDCTERQGQNLKGSAKDSRFPILAEAARLLKPGARYRFEGPAKLTIGEAALRGMPPDAVLVWELEHVRKIVSLPIPEFQASPEDKIKTTASGLKYEILKEGTGKSPAMGQKVTVHYAGWLTDGKLFDSSFSGGEPISFSLGQVIQGWNEGLPLMKEGAVFKFTIPQELAYGESGSPPAIPPKSTLIFHVELIKVE